MSQQHNIGMVASNGPVGVISPETGAGNGSNGDLGINNDRPVGAVAGGISLLEATGGASTPTTGESSSAGGVHPPVVTLPGDSPPPSPALEAAGPTFSPESSPLLRASQGSINFIDVARDAHEGPGAWRARSRQGSKEGTRGAIGRPAAAGGAPVREYY